MGSFLLRVTYRVRADNLAEFEEILTTRVLPIAEEMKISLKGVWKTLVGDAGEFMELWEFSSLAEFESKWKALMAHPGLREIFKTTGPMVEGERFTILEPLEMSSRQPSKLP